MALLKQPDYASYTPRQARFVKRWTPRMVAFGELIDGYDLLVIGVAMLSITPSFGLENSPWAAGALSAAGFVGAAIGLAVFGRITDRIGRRPIFMVNLLFFVVASVLSAFVPDSQVWLLFIARFIIGFAVGMDIPVSQAFLAEISPNTHRGRLAGSLPNIMWLFGAIASVLVAMVANWLLGDAAWRLLFGIAAVPALIIFLMRRMLPESPRWLLEHGHTEEAMKVFELLDLDPAPAIAALEQKKAHSTRRVRMTKKMAVRLAAVTVFFAFQSFAGAVSTVSGPIVLNTLAFPKELTLLWSLIGFVLGLIAVLIGAQIIDRVDRRKLGMITVAILFVISIAIAVFAGLSAAVLVVLYFVFSFTTWFGPGVLAWVWSSEALPTALRGTGSGIAQAVTRLAIALNVFLVPWLLGAIGFWTIALYGLSYVVCFIVLAMNPWLSDTGKDLELVDEEAAIDAV